MREIINYCDINSLHTNSYYNDICNYPHITVSSDMKKQMIKKYGKNSKLPINKINNIFSLKELQTKIIGNWDYTKLEQILSLSFIIRNLNIPNKKEDLLCYQSIKQNKIELLNSIRLLIEADVLPKDIEPENIDEKYLKIIWEKYEQEEPIVKEFRQSIDKCFKDRDYINSIIHEFNIDKYNIVVLHGFYFVTPIQERIFRILENCGKRLIFLCNIQTINSEIDKIWYSEFENTFDKEQKFLWKKYNQRSVNRDFQNIFDCNIKNNTIKNNIKIIKYSSQMDFIRDVKRLKDKNNYKIYTTDKRLTENLLKDYYPELFRERNYLSYPIGQYIYVLHSIWNENKKSICINIDDLRIFFASGLVSKDKKNGIDYLDDLDKISTFIGDCETIEDWKKRIKLLRDIKTNVVNLFEDNNIQNCNNPFYYFSCFDISEDRLNDLILLIEDILDVAKVLFSSNSDINIKEYLYKLRSILSKKEVGLNDSLKEEQEIFKAIWNELEINNITLEKCLPSEICEAIKFTLSGKRLDFLDIDDEDVNEEKTFYSVFELDSSPIACENKVLHLCFTDDTLMPGKNKAYMWPITTSFLKRLETKCRNDGRYYIASIRFIIENNSIIKRYLFNCLMQNKNIEFSYISNIENENRNLSPYVEILRNIYDLKCVYINELQEINCNNNLKELDNFLSLNENYITSDEIKINDKKICLWKYIYNYKLNNYQSYIDGFHYTFAITKLISLIRKRTDLDLELIKGQTINLFPYLYEIQKKQLKDYVSVSYHDEIDNDLNYFNIHYLNQEVINIANNGYCGLTDEEEVKYYICMYCAYANTCPHRNRLLRRPTDIND